MIELNTLKIAVSCRWDNVRRVFAGARGLVVQEKVDRVCSIIRNESAPIQLARCYRAGSLGWPHPML